jgi:ankyrin repeat protein
LQNALSLAIENKNYKQIQGLMIAGADVNERKTYGSPMKQAYILGDYNVLKNLLEGGGNPYNQEVSGTPFDSLVFHLHHAGKENKQSAAILRLFLEYGAAIDLKANKENLPFMISESLIPIIEEVYNQWEEDGNILPFNQEKTKKMKFK